MVKSRWAMVIPVLGLLVMAASASGQQLTVDKTVHDFGPVRDGDIVQCAFLLANAGGAAITISNVSYNCSCTSYAFLLDDGRTQRAPYVVYPGQSVNLQVTFRTSGYSRYAQPVSHVLTITSSDPTRRSFQVTFRATVLTTLPSYLASALTFAAEHFFLVDLRPPEEFAKGHLYGSINVPWSEFDSCVPQLPCARAYVLYDQDGSLAPEAASRMRARGYFGVTFLSGGLARWHAELGDKYLERVQAGTIPSATVASLGGAYSQSPTTVAGAYLAVVDLSTPEEFARAHIPGSVNLAESQVTAWAWDLVQRLGLGTKTAIALWLLDDIGGTASYRAAQQLVNYGFKAISVQGGRAALQADTGSQLLWPFAGE